MCVEFVNDFVRKCLCLCTITRQRLFDATVASSVSHNLAETVLDLCNSYVLIDAEHVEIYIHAYIHTHTYTYIYIYIYIYSQGSPVKILYSTYHNPCYRPEIFFPPLSSRCAFIPKGKFRRAFKNPTI